MIGRYSDALDAQLEFLNFWSQPVNKERNEYIWVERLGMDRGAITIQMDFTLRMLEVAEPFYVSAPICELLYEASKSIPETWTFTEDALYIPAGFVWLSTPFPTVDEEYPSRALAWATVDLNDRGWRMLAPAAAEGERIVAISFFDELKPFPALLPQAFMLVKLGANLQMQLGRLQPNGRMFNEESGRKRARLFATLMAFLQQRILVSPKFVADRAARRRFKNATRKPLSDEIRPVMLRKAVYAGKGEHRDVKWTCQWAVHWHWRNQPYGPVGQKYYRPKYIASYIKGPEDKPLRHPERLFAVVR